MIEALFFKKKKGCITGFSVEGHSGFVRKGQPDIVCSAVSAIVYTTLGGLINVAKTTITYETNNDGFAQCRLSGENSPGNVRKASVILDTMHVGLRQIEAKYPKHVQVKVIDEEV